MANQVLRHIESGYRMQIPDDCCPPTIYKLMLDTWNSEPDERPSFVQICDQLCSIYKSDLSEYNPLGNPTERLKQLMNHDYQPPPPHRRPPAGGINTDVRTTSSSSPPISSFKQIDDESDVVWKLSKPSVKENSKSPKTLADLVSSNFTY